MKKIIHFATWLFMFVTVITPIHAKSPKKRIEIPVKDPLENRIRPSSSRYETYRYVLELMAKRNVKTIVETGTARLGNKNCDGDGCSTIIWGDWAVQHGAVVYSVDIDPSALNESKGACQYCLNNIVFVESDSIAFLKGFGQPIDFLYLDSYDFDWSNPAPSQEHHLKEVVAVYPYLHGKTIIMIDDCDLPYGGKGALVIQYLLDRGWKIELSKYQVIMTYER